MTAPLTAAQITDIQTLVREPFHALHLAPGSMKTRTTIEAAQQLYARGEIDAVLVLAPANVRSVWASPDPTLGEIAKWTSGEGGTSVWEYHARTAKLPEPVPGSLLFVISNPEFIRRPQRLEPLLQWVARHRVLLVVEESWFIRSPRAAQTKAVWKLRRACARVVFLNGTPGEPRHQFTTFQMMDPGILGVKNEFQFRYKYCQIGGFRGKEIVGYAPEQMAEFARRTAPYVTVRTETPWSDDPVRSQIDVPMPSEVWKLYVAMREDAVARLADKSSVAVTAAVTSLRLAQLTAGILGGLQDRLDDPSAETAQVSAFKADAIHRLVTLEQHEKVVIFCQFRAEIAQLQEWFLGSARHDVVRIWGDQPKEEREHALSLFAPGGDPSPAIALVHPASGGAGISLVQSSLALFASQTASSRIRTQAEGRIFRPGQTRTPRFVDVLATGPNGEPTVDHILASAIRRKERVETWTADAWREAILETIR